MRTVYTDVSDGFHNYHCGKWTAALLDPGRLVIGLLYDGKSACDLVLENDPDHVQFYFPEVAEDEIAFARIRLDPSGRAVHDVIDNDDFRAMLMQIHRVCVQCGKEWNFAHL
jgi:hypothetical protein